MTLERGVATKEDIDKTLKLGMAHPMGPLELGEWGLSPAEMQNSSSLPLFMLS